MLRPAAQSKQSENTQHAITQDLLTDDPKTSVLVGTQNAIVGHRDFFVPAPDPVRCAVRLRLSPSRPFARGSVWRAQRESVLAGFETGFTFQISSHSRSCTAVKDRNFNTQHHQVPDWPACLCCVCVVVVVGAPMLTGCSLLQSCAVHGADGFAFVMHSDPGGYNVVGNGGKHMGYGGIRKSIAVEFDTWYNPELGDLFNDHVRCIHACGLQSQPCLPPPSRTHAFASPTQTASRPRATFPTVSAKAHAWECLDPRPWLMARSIVPRLPTTAS